MYYYHMILPRIFIVKKNGNHMEMFQFNWENMGKFEPTAGPAKIDATSEQYQIIQSNKLKMIYSATIWIPICLLSCI